MQNLSIVIPVYNEGNNIRSLFEALEKHVGTQAEILICYDFDEDNTLPAVAKWGGQFPHLRLVKNKYGSGCIGAIKSGISIASRPAVLVSMADLSDDLSIVEKMMHLFEQGCAVVVASRYVRGGQQIGGPFLKKLLSRFAGASLHYLTGLPAFDPTNNFKLYAKRYLESVTIESEGGFEIGLELTVKAYLRGAKIGECPTVWRDRSKGTSRFQFRKWLPKYLHWYVYALKKKLFTKA